MWKLVVKFVEVGSQILVEFQWSLASKLCGNWIPHFCHQRCNQGVQNSINRVTFEHFKIYQNEEINKE